MWFVLKKCKNKFVTKNKNRNPKAVSVVEGPVLHNLVNQGLNIYWSSVHIWWALSLNKFASKEKYQWEQKK